MKKLLILFYLFCACTKPTKLTDNPLDPEGGDYEIPLVEIIADFAQGQTISSSSVTFQMEGNEMVAQFRYRLDDDPWTIWSEIKTVTLDYLDEGEHVISAQARYITEETSAVLTLGFTVDAVSGPALMFFPRRKFADLNGTVTFQVLAEEVQDLAGLEFGLDFDPSEVSIQGVASGAIFDESGDPIFLTDQSEQGQLIITSAVWGQDSPSFTGTGPIAEITLRVQQAGSISINFDGSEIFRNQNNSEISIQETVPGLIVAN